VYARDEERTSFRCPLQWTLAAAGALVKRASYRRGIELVALNDEPGELDAEVVQTQISVILLADLFEIPVERVARDVVRIREKELRAREPRSEAAS
jgi:hypothetical protein